MRYSRTLLAVFFSLLFLAPNGWATGLQSLPSEELYKVLCTVNAEWRKKPELAQTISSPFHDFSEQSLLRTHLMLVEEYLRAHPPTGLDPIQTQRRLHHLDVLNEYWKAGNFPNNPDFSIRTPYFIGPNGNFCAVGYVMWQDGQQEVVKRIEREINNAYVREIPYPELGQWADANGFEVDELAWIQPTYCANCEFLESIWVEHRGGNVWRIWRNASSPCFATDSSLVLQDTAGLMISPVGCTSSAPVAISPWVVFKKYNDYGGINYKSVVCSTATPEMGKAVVAYKDFLFSGSGCTQWKVSMTSGSRFAWGGLGNSNQAGNIWIGNSTIDLNVPNSAPKFSHTLPLSVVMNMGGFAKYYVGGVDQDGDSLSYHLDTCRIAAGTMASYFTYLPYPQASPQMPFGTDFPITLNPSTGELKIESIIGGTFYFRRGAFVIRVDEHRNGVVINSTYKEVTMDVSILNPFQNPAIEEPTNISGGTWNSVDQYFNTCLGDTLSFHVMLTDSAMDSTLLVKNYFPVGGVLKNAANGTITDTILDAVAEGIIEFVPTQEGWYEFPFIGFTHRGQIMNSTSRSFRVKVQQGPLPTVQQTIVACSNAEIEVNGLAGYANWSWSGDYVQPVNDSVLLINYPTPGLYNYQLVAQGPNQCPITFQGIVNVPNIGQPAYTVTTSTQGCLELGFSVVSQQGSFPTWSYQWSGDAGLATNQGANSNNLIHIYPSGGQFNWAVSVVDTNGCEVVQTGVASVMDDSPGFQASIIQNGCSPTVNFQSSPDNPAQPFLVQWSGPGGVNGNPGRNSTSFTHTFPGPGIYPIQVTYSSSAGCDSTEVISLVIPALQPPIWAMGDTLFTNQAVSYQWYRDSLAIPGANSVTFSPSISGYYSVWVTDSMGCSGASQPIYFGLSAVSNISESGVNVYPIPSSNVLNIELSEIATAEWNWEIWTLQGQLISHGHVINQNFTKVNTMGFPSGVYFLRINTEEGVAVRRIEILSGF